MKRDLLNAAALAAALLVLAIGGPLIVRQLGTFPARSLAARAGERVVTLEVSGMTCRGCASSVEKGLAGIAGVSAATVRLQQRRAYVVCGRAVTDTSLIAAVRHAGPGFSAAVTPR